MKRLNSFSLLALLLVVAMVLAACPNPALESPAPAAEDGGEAAADDGGDMAIHFIRRYNQARSGFFDFVTNCRI